MTTPSPPEQPPQTTASPDFDAEAIGWRRFFQDQLSVEELESGFQPARVCRGQARRCHVWSSRGTKSLAVNLFGDQGLPAVGDWLVLDPKQKQPPRRLERFSALARQAPGSKFATQVLAANVDTLFIVTACNEDFNVGRIERYLALVAEAGTQPVLVLTKADLTDSTQTYVQQARALDDSLPIECLDTRDPTQLAPLRQRCGPGQTVAALGSSGVGKSTLINTLSGSAQAVGDVRGDDNKGKHTTTSRSLHRLVDGGVLVDLPGIRELQLTEAAAGLDDTFAEITALATDCKFRNCQHQDEPGCAIRNALKTKQLDPRRWESYRKLRGEQSQFTQTKAEHEKREDRKVIRKKDLRRLDKEHDELP